jgi:hypothetical protein
MTDLAARLTPERERIRAQVRSTRRSQGFAAHVTDLGVLDRLPLLGAVAGPGLTVGATQHTRVDRYRGLGR